MLLSQLNKILLVLNVILKLQFKHCVVDTGQSDQAELYCLSDLQKELH